MNERARRAERLFEIPIVVAALLVIPVMAIEQSALDEPWRTVAAVTNWLIWLAFAAELVVMLALVADRRRWLREHPLDVAIVVLTPPFLPEALQALRVFRLLRLLRLLVVVRYARRVFTAGGLRYVGVLALVTAFGGGTAFAAAEGRDVSTWDGIWWALATMTTVGYGDFYPETTLGRIIAIAVMLVGIGVLTLVIGASAERFVATTVAAEVEETEHDVVDDVEAARTELLAEIRAIGERLREVETRIERAGRR